MTTKFSAPVRSDDRVLLLAIPHRDELAGLARVLMQGVLVALGTREEVDQAREAMADFDNVMFVEALADKIPWRDAYFTKILVPPHLEPLLGAFGSELDRVLAPGGEIVRQTANA
ncbi:MAG: class I SAM-dependent methyltransferase [Acidobacteriota bacterium]|nr:class I SAM-dependent methyltransferase [Acidobacteriota bacterium]